MAFDATVLANMREAAARVRAGDEVPADLIANMLEAAATLLSRQLPVVSADEDCGPSPMERLSPEREAAVESAYLDRPLPGLRTPDRYTLDAAAVLADHNRRFPGHPLTLAQVEAGLSAWSCIVTGGR